MFNALPKRITYTQLNGLGECSMWTPWECWGDTQLAQAREELAKAHNTVLDYANLAYAMLEDVKTWPEGVDKDYSLVQAEKMVSDGLELVRLDTQMMNEWESKTGESGLSGLGRLGLAPAVLALLPVVETVLLVGGLLALGITTASAVKSNFEAAKANSNAFIQYYKSCEEIIKRVGKCDLKAPGDNPGSFSLNVTTVAVIGIAAALLIGFMRSR